MGTLLAILISIVFMVTPAIAAPPDVMTIMKQLKEVFEPVRPSARKVVISVDYKEGKVQWTATQARKKFPDGKRMLMVMLEPEDIRGLAILYWEPENKPSVMWLYVPALHRIRQLRLVEAYEHFLGTDFTYADLGFTPLHEQYKLLGEEELAGRRTYKVEEKILQEGSHYSHIIN
jgi:hypothetical protein